MCELWRIITLAHGIHNNHFQLEASVFNYVVMNTSHFNVAQLLIFGTAVCMAFAYPGYEQYSHYGQEHSGGYHQQLSGYADDGHDFGLHLNHPVASQRIDGHHHEALDQHQQHDVHEHEEHVDYYVSGTGGM